MEESEDRTIDNRNSNVLLCGNPEVPGRDCELHIRAYFKVPTEVYIICICRRIHYGFTECMHACAPLTMHTRYTVCTKKTGITGFVARNDIPAMYVCFSRQYGVICLGFFLSFNLFPSPQPTPRNVRLLHVLGVPMNY